MSSLVGIREELGAAIATAGWHVYKVIPDAGVRFPCAIVTFNRLEYNKTHGGKLVAFVDVEVIASAADVLQAQRLIDEACSWGTDYSIGSALDTYDGYTHVKNIIQLGADGFDGVTINEDTPGYSATIYLEVHT